MEKMADTPTFTPHGHQKTYPNLQLEEMIGQVEGKYLATALCGDQLVLWDQHDVVKRIRLEEMMVSTLTPGDSHWTVSLECPLLVSLPTQEETSCVQQIR